MTLKARCEQRQYSVAGMRLRLPQVSLMCARYWLGEFLTFDFELLLQEWAAPRRWQALLHLVYGQLLVARKIDGAFAYLDRGLRLADGLVKPAAYFEIYNRHTALRSLRLTRDGVAGMGLTQLMNEAGVIDKITQRSGTEMTFRASRYDTLMHKSWK